jgi:hypothetical protein
MSDLRLDRFLSQARLLLSAIERELESAHASISASQLQRAREKVRAMERRVATGDLPPRELRTKTLTRLIIDEWPLGTPLGNALVDLEAQYVAL